MVDLLPQFETTDLVGTVTHFSGTATTTPAQVPSSPSTVISELLIRNTNTQGLAKLQVSFDGGTAYFDIDAGDTLIWGPKGEILSIYIRSSSGNVTYQILMNREPAS